MTPEVQSYRFGQIEIDGESFHRDVIIFPEGLRSDWWRERGHHLSVLDLEEVFAAEADVLIIGQGTYSRMQVPQETRERALSARVLNFTC